MGKLIEIENLKKHFYSGKIPLGGHRESIKAIDGISFHIDRKEVLGLVGESGCGKTTCGKVILRIHEPTEGSIRFQGDEITGLDKKEMLPYRRKMMIIYQDPFGSLDPRMTVGGAIAEPMIVHRTTQRKEISKGVDELMEMVGLLPEQKDRFPHQFSGGQRQRIGIARALATDPEFIVADESVSALDVSIQAQIINLLQQLQRDLGLTLLFISHDLSVVKHISDRIAVMYVGKIVEIAPKTKLFDAPRHPYTQALLTSIPVPNPLKRGKNQILAGDVPSPINPPPGCRFHTRCPHVMDICKKEEPPFYKTDGIHSVACFLYREQ